MSLVFSDSLHRFATLVGSIVGVTDDAEAAAVGTISIAFGVRSSRWHDTQRRTSAIVRMPQDCTSSRSARREVARVWRNAHGLRVGHFSSTSVAWSRRMSQLELGTVLLHKYRIDRLRVASRDVNVYDATDTVHERHVSIKVMGSW